MIWLLEKHCEFFINFNSILVLDIILTGYATGFAIFILIVAYTRVLIRAQTFRKSVLSQFTVG